MIVRWNICGVVIIFLAQSRSCEIGSWRQSRSGPLFGPPKMGLSKGKRERGSKGDLKHATHGRTHVFLKLLHKSPSGSITCCQLFYQKIYFRHCECSRTVVACYALWWKQLCQDNSPEHRRHIPSRMFTWCLTELFSAFKQRIYTRHWFRIHQWWSFVQDCLQRPRSRIEMEKARIICWLLSWSKSIF